MPRSARRSNRACSHFLRVFPSEMMLGVRSRVNSLLAFWATAAQPFSRLRTNWIRWAFSTQQKARERRQNLAQPLL